MNDFNKKIDPELDKGINRDFAKPKEIEIVKSNSKITCDKDNEIDGGKVEAFNDKIEIDEDADKDLLSKKRRRDSEENKEDVKMD